MGGRHIESQTDWDPATLRIRAPQHTFRPIRCRPVVIASQAGRLCIREAALVEGAADDRSVRTEIPHGLQIAK